MEFSFDKLFNNVAGVNMINNSIIAGPPPNNYPIGAAAARREVFNLVRKHTSDIAYPYGGYVRDTIAGNDPNDLDLVLVSEQCLGTFVHRLHEKGCIIQYIKDITYFEESRGFKYHINYNGYCAMVDVSWSIDPSLPFLNGYKFDADINTLYVDSTNQLRSLLPVHVESIVENIHNRKMWPIKQSVHRYTKMSAKGYSNGGTMMTFDDAIKNVPVYKDGPMGPAAQPAYTLAKQTHPKKDGFLDILKKDAEQVAYRQGAEKITIGTRHAIEYMAKEAFKLSDDQLATVSLMLNHEVGQALLAVIIGYGLLAVPGTDENQIIQNLAANFRAQGMHQATNAGLDKVYKASQDKLFPMMKLIMESIKAAQDGNVFEAASKMASIELPLRVSVDEPPAFELDIQAEEEAAEELEDNKFATCT